MQEQFRAFIAMPSKETFLVVRERILQSGCYQPRSNDLERLQALLEKNELEAAKQVLAAAMPNLLLSPRAHLLAALLHHKLGDAAGAKTEGTLAAQCCAGILTTGQGTEAQPYLVLRISDEYDIVRFLEREFDRQAVFHRDGQHFDRLTCVDGSELWFDVSDIYRQEGERMRELLTGGGDLPAVGS